MGTGEASRASPAPSQSGANRSPGAARRTRTQLRLRCVLNPNTLFYLFLGFVTCNWLTDVVAIDYLAHWLEALDVTGEPDAHKEQEN